MRSLLAGLASDPTKYSQITAVPGTTDTKTARQVLRKHTIRRDSSLVRKRVIHQPANYGEGGISPTCKPLERRSGISTNWWVNHACRGTYWAPNALWSVYWGRETCSFGWVAGGPHKTFRNVAVNFREQRLCSHFVGGCFDPGQVWVRGIGLNGVTRLWTV